LLEQGGQILLFDRLFQLGVEQFLDGVDPGASSPARRPPT